MVRIYPSLAPSPLLALNSTQLSLSRPPPPPVGPTIPTVQYSTQSSTQNATRHTGAKSMLTAGRAQPVPVCGPNFLQVIDGWGAVLPYPPSSVSSHPQHMRTQTASPRATLWARARVRVFAHADVYTLDINSMHHATADHPESSLSCQCPPLASNSQSHSKCPFLRGRHWHPALVSLEMKRGDFLKGSSGPGWRRRAPIRARRSERGAQTSYRKFGSTATAASIALGAEGCLHGRGHIVHVVWHSCGGRTARIARRWADPLLKRWGKGERGGGKGGSSTCALMMLRIGRI